MSPTLSPILPLDVFLRRKTKTYNLTGQGDLDFPIEHVPKETISDRFSKANGNNLRWRLAGGLGISNRGQQSIILGDGG